METFYRTFHYTTLHYTAQICESGTYSSWSSMLVTLISNDHAQTVTADSANSYKQNQIEQHYFWARNEVAPVRTRNSFMLIYKSGGWVHWGKGDRGQSWSFKFKRVHRFWHRDENWYSVLTWITGSLGGGAYWFVSWKMIVVSEPEETLEEWTSSIETGWI